MRKLSAIFILLVITVATVYAQSDSAGFYVQSFRKLERDLDARINHPVLDQNSRKAALIKVVIPEDGFDFDVGVMGVVGVRQEVGEIWVYVPEGVQKITVRHQTYGVIRDYEFGCPIESAAVYELRLHVPVQPKIKVVVKDSIVYVPTPVYKKATQSGTRFASGGQFNERKRIKRTKWSVLAVTSVPTPSVGLMATWHARKVGAYIKAEGRLKQSGVDYYIYDGSGTVWNGIFSRLAITAGGIFRCTDWLGISTGVGYGQCLLHCGQQSGSINSKRLDLYRFEKGFSLDFVGVVVRLGHFTTYLGGNMDIPYTTSNGLDFGEGFFEFGVGYSF